MGPAQSILIVDEDTDTGSTQDDSWAYQDCFDQLGFDYEVMTGNVPVDNMLGYSSVFYANSLSTKNTWYYNSDCDDFDVTSAQAFAEYVVDDAGNFFWANGLMTYFPPNGLDIAGVNDLGFCQMIGCASSGTPPWSGWAGWGAHSLHTIQGSFCHRATMRYRRYS